MRGTGGIGYKIYWLIQGFQISQHFHCLINATLKYQHFIDIGPVFLNMKLNYSTHTFKGQLVPFGVLRDLSYCVQRETDLLGHSDDSRPV